MLHDTFDKKKEFDLPLTCDLEFYAQGFPKNMDY